MKLLSRLCKSLKLIPVSFSIGLRQGEVMSPILLFLFFIALELFLENDETSCLSIDDIDFNYTFVCLRHDYIRG